MNEEQTIALEELGEIKTVKVYNQAYVDNQQKCITELEQQNMKIKSLLKEIYEEYGFCELVKIRNDLPTEIQEVLRTSEK